MLPEPVSGKPAGYGQENLHSPLSTLQEDTCLELVNEAVAGEPGIVNVSLDTRQERLSFAYDPAVVSERDISRVAHQLAPELQQRWQTCTLRLQRRGGRACESCALALENRVGHLEGVRRATASYIGGVLTIAYDGALTSPGQLTQRVRQLGIPVAPSAVEPARPPATLARARRWLAAGWLEAIFVAITLVSMLLGLLSEVLLALPAASTVAYVVAYVTGGVFGLKAGLESLRNRTIDVDLLMILAAVGAVIVGAPFEGAMLLFLFSLSNVLQNYALGRTRNAIRSLMKLRPEQALVRRGDVTATLPIDQITVGDQVLVRPGERVPLDGVILEGESSLDQSSLTGESLPVSKHAGDVVFAGTINQRGSLEVRVTRLAKDSTIARLIRLVEEAHSEKAKTQRFIDRAEQYYAAGVIAFTALAIIVPIFLLGEPFQPAFYRAMTLMVAASPCALVISTPATVLSAIGNGARRGVLFKGGVYVEQAAAVRVVAFDKTGTLTVGRPQVTDVRIRPGLALAEHDLLALAAAVEARSEHPLAQAIVNAARERRLELAEATAFQGRTGLGVAATVGGQEILVGNPRFLEQFQVAGLAEAAGDVERLQDEGKTSVIVARRTGQGAAEALGVIAIADVLRPQAPAVIRDLKRLGIKRVVMLTGDNQRVAQAIARQAGVDDFYAELLPEDKMAILKQLEQQHGPVAMVGDGVNDAPALATAAIGLAMGAAGTDVALETADIVLMSDDLANIPYAIALSRQTRKTLLQNLVFALGVIAVLVAAVLGFELALPLSVVGHEGSTVLVSLNGLRLLAYRR